MDPGLLEGAETESIPASAVPRVSFRVRRRRTHERTWLLENNRLFEVDEVTDAVWLACQERLSVEGIIRRIAARRDLSIGEATEIAVITLLRFRQLGLVHW